jgi:hypothetical protein
MEGLKTKILGGTVDKLVTTSAMIKSYTALNLDVFIFTDKPMLIVYRLAYAQIRIDQRVRPSEFQETLLTLISRTAKYGLAVFGPTAGFVAKLKIIPNLTKLFISTETGLIHR